MLSAWRIVPAHRVATAFDGEGARLYGGRWNSRGLAAVYGAGSRALAALEVLVHLHSSQLNLQYSMIEVSFPKELLKTLKPHAVSADQLGSTVNPVTQQIGDQWLRSGISPVLKVFSSIIPEEPNFLFNPRHSAFNQLKIGAPRPFAFDNRLLER